MANDGKIYIIITNRTPEQVEAGTSGVEQKQQDTGSGVLGDYIKHQFFHFVESQAKQAIAYSINNIGNFTGDYEMQRHATALSEIANRLMSIGSSAVSGATIGAKAGPYGAVIGAVVGAIAGTASVTIGDIRTEYLKGYADKKKNLSIEQLRARSGMYPLLDGNRGTEN